MSLTPNSGFQFAGRQPHFWNECEALFSTEGDLISAALLLGAADVQLWSSAEESLAQTVSTSVFTRSEISLLRDLISTGADPLGEAFCALRTPVRRRADGATYTPAPIVRSMVEWAACYATPARIIDPGTGSARFLIQAGKAYPRASLIGIEIDPLAALIARANIAVAELAKRSRIILGDYRCFNEKIAESTLYIGNPPYVRHHQIPAHWKAWLSDEARRLGYKASQLAGLHVHFFLATALNSRPGDFGAFITAAEWLDVNYGSLVRSILSWELGARSITVIEPTAQPFPDAAATAAIVTFETASQPAFVSFSRVERPAELNGLNNGRKVVRDRLLAETRWSRLTRPPTKPPEGFVELGELCRVHRGQVTGSNEVWIAGAHSECLPDQVLYPCVTRAKEVISAAGVLRDSAMLRSVIDIPVDLDEFDASERRAINRFLKIARSKGADTGYIASHRKAWWSVGLRAPAPIISTYMARRAPAFVLNVACARHINVAHGLYPREAMSETARTTLVQFLQTKVSQRSGRTYAGGLTKFEPREMERLIVPSPSMLAAGIMR